MYHRHFHVLMTKVLKQTVVYYLRCVTLCVRVCARVCLSLFLSVFGC